MTVYLDTEFNGFGGELISLALVSDRGAAFYGVLPLPKSLDPWAAEHVVPVLGREPEPPHEFRKRLRAFLAAHRDEEVIADWYEDLMHLLACLGDAKGRAFSISLRIRLVMLVELDSEVPHNALSDAKALMRWGQRKANDRSIANRVTSLQAEAAPELVRP